MLENVNNYYTGFPETINGHEVETDFRIWLKVNYIFKSERHMIQKIAQIRDIVFNNNIPSLTTGDIEALKDFLSCNIPRVDLEEDKKENPDPTFDFDADAHLVYQAFIEKYNISLVDCEYMHWWEFNARLRACMRSNALMKVVQTRTLDIGELISSGAIKENSKQHIELNKDKDRVSIELLKRQVK